MHIEFRLIWPQLCTHIKTLIVHQLDRIYNVTLYIANSEGGIVLLDYSILDANKVRP